MPPGELFERIFSVDRHRTAAMAADQDVIPK
jgi:hypothetical protein